MAFLVLLEALSPVERAVFMPREVFGYGYPDVAKTAVEDVRYEAAVFNSSLGANGGTGVSWEAVARVAHFVPDIPPASNPGLMNGSSMTPGNSPSCSGRTSPRSSRPRDGDITIDRFLAVDDCGPLLNPLLARGQVHGGIAQGLGQALLEGARYDDDGSLASHNWTTYAFPRAQHIPRSKPRTPSPRHRSPRSGSRESARPERSGPRRPSSTPSWTRWPRSE